MTGPLAIGLRQWAACLLLPLAIAEMASAQVSQPVWSVGVGGGLHADASGSVALVRAERAWRGPLRIGGRVWSTAGSGFVDDGPTTQGSGGEAYAAAIAMGGWADLRASGGIGLATVDYSSGGFCIPDVPCGGGSYDGVRPYAVLGLGVDVFPFPALGLGTEVRGVLAKGQAMLSTVEVGLRVRFGR